MAKTPASDPTAEPTVIPPERPDPTPADLFNAWLRAGDARGVGRPRRRRSTRPQIAGALVLGLSLWAVILAGLSRAVFGWP